MTRGVITNYGFTQSSNAYSRSEFGFKFKIVGARTSEGDTNHTVYNTGGDEALMQERMRALLDFTGGDVFPAGSEFIPITSAVPISGTPDNPTYSMVYEFQINPADVITPFNIREIGLFAQMYVETSQWTYKNSYTAGTSYVWHGNNFYVAASNFTAIPDWTSITNYVITDRVAYEGQYYDCKIANLGVIPTDTNYWKLVPANSVQPASGNPGWALIVKPNANPTQSLLLPYGDPYLYQIEIRDVPIAQNTEHTTRWVTTIEFTESTATITFSDTDTVGYTELQLAYLDTTTQQNRQIRNLATQVEINTSDIQTINDNLNLP